MIPTIRGPFKVAFNTPGLSTGVQIYQPTVGEILLDFWVEVNQAWDGTTPLGDLYGFTNAWVGTNGYFNGVFRNHLIMSIADKPPLSGGRDWTYGNQQSGGRFAADFVVPTLNQGNALYRVSGNFVDYPASCSLYCNPMKLGARILPARCLNATPFSFCVSQTGLPGDASPGATQGQASIYLLSAIPAQGGTS